MERGVSHEIDQSELEAIEAISESIDSGSFSERTDLTGRYKELQNDLKNAEEFVRGLLSKRDELVQNKQKTTLRNFSACLCRANRKCAGIKKELKSLCNSQKTQFLEQLVQHYKGLLELNSIEHSSYHNDDLKFFKGELGELDSGVSMPSPLSDVGSHIGESDASYKPRLSGSLGGKQTRRSARARRAATVFDKDYVGGAEFDDDCVKLDEVVAAAAIGSPTPVAVPAIHDKVFYFNGELQFANNISHVASLLQERFAFPVAGAQFDRAPNLDGVPDRASVLGEAPYGMGLTGSGLFDGPYQFDKALDLDVKMDAGIETSAALCGSGWESSSVAAVIDAAIAAADSVVPGSRPSLAGNSSALFEGLKLLPDAQSDHDYADAQANHDYADWFKGLG